MPPLTCARLSAPSRVASPAWFSTSVDISVCSPSASHSAPTRPLSTTTEASTSNTTLCLALPLPKILRTIRCARHVARRCRSRPSVTRAAAALALSPSPLAVSAAAAPSVRSAAAMVERAPISAAPKLSFASSCHARSHVAALARGWRSAASASAAPSLPAAPPSSGGSRRMNSSSANARSAMLGTSRRSLAPLSLRLLTGHVLCFRSQRVISSRL
mmetsp:Transcript_1422/g.5648  ORF Transcript_1422/g.5648 Transcript_1422/m.5648 type:complete len:216 (+) Transcript_1422:393-1040(+)